MENLTTMYPPQAGSPETTLAGALTASGTTATVIDGSLLPEAPNYLTIGAEYGSAETVLMTAKNGNTITIIRAQDNTAARSWAAGIAVARCFTAADQAALQENVNKLNTGKANKPSSAVNGNLAGLDANGDLTDSGKKSSDFAAAGHTHSTKADKVSGAVSGNFAGLNSNGNLTDSGKKAADFANASHSHDVSDLTGGTLPVERGGTGNTSVDTTPTNHSTRMVTSTGVKSYVDSKQPKISTVLLLSGSWVNKTQTKNIPTIQASETTQVIIVTPALADQAAYYECGIRVTAQAAGSLTFTCDKVPTASSQTVHVSVQGV